jgi:hypothetical protein
MLRERADESSGQTIKAKRGNKLKGAKINCGIFQQEEEVIRGLTLQINQIKLPEIRKIRAQDLLDKVDKLLDCWMYEEGRGDCYNCQLISRLRKKTALFVIGVSDLER